MLSSSARRAPVFPPPPPRSTSVCGPMASAPAPATDAKVEASAIAVPDPAVVDAGPPSGGGGDNEGGDDAEAEMSAAELSAEDSVASEMALIDAALKRQNDAATKLQTYMRMRYIAPALVKKRFWLVWMRVYDPRFRMYFWYNRSTKKPQWTRPYPNGTEEFTREELKMAWRLIRVIRGFIGRTRARKLAHVKFTRYFDAKQLKFYWVNNHTQEARWQATQWLLRQEVPMPAEDSLLYQSQMRIRELEAMLKRKDEEIKVARAQRFEELEPLVLRDKVAKARDLDRSDHMDEWTMEQLCSWFEELKMAEHVPYLLANRVDGNLFINLVDADWPEMGIVTRLHTRKLQLIMKAYRVRFARKKAGISDEDADEISEYAPSELSDIIGAEGGESDDDMSDDEDDLEDGGERRLEIGSQGSDEELTEEQRLERQLDAKNIHIETLVTGDELNYPLVGDVVRVRYNCTLVATGSLVASTKTQMFRQSVEFALGYGQVIKGFDRALPKMSIGERSKITVSPEYAYGKAGLFPNIPPDAELCFELTLLGFKARVVWYKPLVQEPGLCQQPYFEEQNDAEDAMIKTEELI